MRIILDSRQLLGIGILLMLSGCFCFAPSIGGAPKSCPLGALHTIKPLRPRTIVSGKRCPRLAFKVRSFVPRHNGFKR